MPQPVLEISAESEFVLEVKYAGPSFEGFMEIGALANEIAGLEYCINKIIRTLQSQKKLPANLNDYKIVVEAFEKGSFITKLLIISDKIEERPATFALIGAAFTCAVTILANSDPDKVLVMSPELAAKIQDKAQVEILSDPIFLKSISSTVQPLSEKEDRVYFKRFGQPENEENKIGHSQKDKFLKLFSSDLLEEKITNRFDEVFGKVISMDLDATKNQIAFKVFGKGERIYCTFPEGTNVNDYKQLLGAWVTIAGDVLTKNDKIIHIDVAGIQEVKDSGYEEKQSDIRLE